MSKIIMLRCYGWWWEDSVENMIRVLDSFIKQLLVNVLAQLNDSSLNHFTVEDNSSTTMTC